MNHKQANADLPELEAFQEELRRIQPRGFLGRTKILRKRRVKHRKSPDLAALRDELHRVRHGGPLVRRLRHLFLRPIELPAPSDVKKAAKTSARAVAIEENGAGVAEQDLNVVNVRSELARVSYRSRFRRTLRSTLSALVVVAAVAVLIITLWMPILRIVGASMSPTLHNGQVVVAMKVARLTPGDIVGFYQGNDLLVKRCIACSGDIVDIDPDGNIYVNSKLLEEPYLTEKAFGECNITLPCLVPEGAYFLVGDHRSTSIDSRNTSVGCVTKDQLLGKIVFCIWPLSTIGILGR